MAVEREELARFRHAHAAVARVGDAGRRLVMKMDVEGAEWESLLATPDEVLQQIDQLAIEFHGVDEEQFVRVVSKLRRFFHVAHLHFNNYACKPDIKPFPAWAFEVLFVNKSIGIVDPSAPAEAPHPLDAPNNSTVPDCQTSDAN